MNGWFGLGRLPTRWIADKVPGSLSALRLPRHSNERSIMQHLSA